MGQPVALKYRGFISYSHADTSWAKWLHRGLEGFRVDKDLIGLETAFGAIPKTLRPSFVIAKTSPPVIRLPNRR